MKNWLGIIAVTLALFGSTAAGLDYFAKASDLELVAVRLEQKILADRQEDTQKRLWQLQDRNNGERDCAAWTNEADRAECRLLKLKIELIKEETENAK